MSIGDGNNEQNQISTKTEAKHSSASSPEPQGVSSTGLKWSEVLGSAASPTERKVRERGKKAEAEVSGEVLQLARENLVEAALVYGRGLNDQKQPIEDKVGNLEGFADVLRQINPNLDFSNPQQIEAAVSKLFEQHGGSAVALGIAYQELKHQAMSKFYKIELTSVAKVNPAKSSSALPTSNEIIINPDGTVTFQSKTTSYEEFIKTPEGKKKRGGIWGLFGMTRPVSRKEFQKILQGEPGKEGRCKISISSESTTSTSIALDQQFLLEQLDLYNQSQPLDPNKPEDFRYLLEEYQRTALMRAEIARATGVPVSEMSNIFEGGFLQTTLSGLRIEVLSNQVKEAMDEERKRIAQETRQQLEKVTQERVVEATRAQLERRVVELEEELEKVKNTKKGHKRNEDMQRLNRISETLGNELSLEFFENNGPTVDKILEKLKILKKEVDEAARAFLVAGGEGELQRLRSTLTQLQMSLTQVRTITHKDGDVENIGDVKGIEASIKATRNDIAGVMKLMEEYETKKSQLEEYNNWLGKEITIDGETKTVREWYEEYVRLKPKEKGGDSGEQGDSERGVEDIEQDLSEARVLLGYFDENEQTKRNASLTKVGGDLSALPDISIEDVQALNPRLAEVLNGLDKDKQKQDLLKILQIVFGQEIILPSSRDDQEVIDLVNFLEKNKNSLSNISSLEGFKELITQRRREIFKSENKAQGSDENSKSVIENGAQKNDGKS